MLRQRLKALYLRHFAGWGPEESLRYLPIRDALASRDLLDRPLLEVGSGGRGVSPYIRRDIVGCDLGFGNPGPFKVHAIKSSAESLPVRSASFDTVLSVDALEHIPAAARPIAIAEMVRVARRAVILMVPAGAPAARHDRELAEYARAKTGQVHHFLEEHIANGLPERSDLEQALEQAAHAQGRTARLESSMRDNLTVRGMLLRNWFSGQPWRQHLLQRSTVLMPLIYRWMSFGDCYRALVIADLGG